MDPHSVRNTHTQAQTHARTCTHHTLLSIIPHSNLIYFHRVLSMLLHIISALCSLLSLLHLLLLSPVSPFPCTHPPSLPLSLSFLYTILSYLSLSSLSLPLSPSLSPSLAP